METNNTLNKIFILTTVVICALLLFCAVFIFFLNDGININNGKIVLSEDDVVIIPGETIEKEFFVENKYGYQTYYRIYLDNEYGSLFDNVDISIRDGDIVIYKKQAYCTDKNDIETLIVTLKANERKNLVISFSFPETLDSSIQNESLEFYLCADISIWRWWFS